MSDNRVVFDDEVLDGYIPDRLPSKIGSQTVFYLRETPVRKSAGIAVDLVRRFLSLAEMHSFANDDDDTIEAARRLIEKIDA